VSWVDVVVVVLALIAAVSGWRHGIAVALLSFVGVLGGAIIGVRLAPLLAEGISNTSTRVIVSVAVVVLVVVLGETTGVFLGRRVRDRITGERTLVIDSTLGAILQALAVIGAAWLVALPLASAGLPAIASGVRGSQVLRAVDSVMPAVAKQVPAQLRQLLGNSGFPDVLSPFAQTPVSATGPPDTSLARSPAAALVRPSVLKIRGKAPSCQRQLEGSGFVFGPELVLTNAHVVAGTDTTTVEGPGKHGRVSDLPARIIYYDPQVDVAVLRVPGLTAKPLSFAPGAEMPGDDGIVLGYPLDGPFLVTPARIRQEINLKGPDIYDSGEVIRDVYTVRAVVQSGNSGGPMIDTSGRVTGVVFGAALDDPETGFVLTVPQISAAVRAAPGRTAAVAPGTCAE
jgi:S1-C subfamily serine protease